MDKNNEIYTKIEQCRGIIRQAENEFHEITIKSKTITCQGRLTFFHFGRSRIFQSFYIKFTQFSKISVEL